MLAFVIGGGGSGKSAYAEELVCRLSPDKTQKKRYYLATMEVYGEEGKRRVAKHRRAREGKDFITIEQKRNLPEAMEKIESLESVCLLECMSNLVANEMFQGDTPCSETDVAEKIIKDVAEFSEKMQHLVIVSNNVFEDGIVYDDATMAYNRALGSVNCALARLADLVVEVVVGIPVLQKGKGEKINENSQDSM